MLYLIVIEKWLLAKAPRSVYSAMSLNTWEQSGACFGDMCHM